MNTPQLTCVDCRQVKWDVRVHIGFVRGQQLRRVVCPKCWTAFLRNQCMPGSS